MKLSIFWCLFSHFSMQMRYKALSIFSDIRPFSRKHVCCVQFFIQLSNLLVMSLQKKSKSLLKHAYSNILKISPPKNEDFQIKNSDIFHISAQNIDCGYSLELPHRGGSNEYPQSMF